MVPSTSGPIYKWSHLSATFQLEQKLVQMRTASTCSKYKTNTKCICFVLVLYLFVKWKTNSPSFGISSSFKPVMFSIRPKTDEKILGEPVLYSSNCRNIQFLLLTAGCWGKPAIIGPAADWRWTHVIFIQLQEFKPIQFSPFRIRIKEFVPISRVRPVTLLSPLSCVCITIATVDLCINWKI